MIINLHLLIFHLKRSCLFVTFPYSPFGAPWPSSSAASMALKLFVGLPNYNPPSWLPLIKSNFDVISFFSLEEFLKRLCLCKERYPSAHQRCWFSIFVLFGLDSPFLVIYGFTLNEHRKTAQQESKTPKTLSLSSIALTCAHRIRSIMHHLVLHQYADK